MATSNNGKQQREAYNQSTWQSENVVSKTSQPYFEQDDEYDDPPPTQIQRGVTTHVTSEHLPVVMHEGVKYIAHEGTLVRIPKQRTQQHQLRQPSQQRTVVDSSVVSHVKRQKEYSRLLYIGIGMMLMLVLYVSGNLLIVLISNTYNDVVYGRPRVSHVSQVVGHHDSDSNPSQFTCMNNNNVISVTEQPGGDATHAKVYTVAKMMNQPLVPCTISFSNIVDGKKAYMIVSIGNNQFSYENTGSEFKVVNH